MKVTVQANKPRCLHAQKVLRGAAHILVFGGCLRLAISPFLYFEAAAFQAIENRRFGIPVQRSAPSMDRAKPDFAGSLPLVIDDGSPFARLDIPRIRISTMGVEEVALERLRLAAGRVPGAASLYRARAAAGSAG